MNPSRAANDDDDGSADNERAIRAAFEAAKRVHLPPGTGGGDGSDPTRELGLAKLQRNDIGNGERFIARRGEDFLYVREVGWHAWTGTHWSKLEGEVRAQLAAQEVAVAIRVEANALEEAGINWRAAEYDRFEGESDPKFRARIVAQFEDRVDKHRKWAVLSGNAARLNAMLEVAAAHLTVDIEAMDPDPWRFNVANGTIELRQPDGAKSDTPYRFVPHEKAHRITRIANCVYEPDAPAVLWNKFLTQMQPDEGMQRFLARWAGYNLSGSTREQALAMFTGDGSNGKSTWVETIAAVMGNYAVSVPFASLLHNDHASGSQATPDLAPLPGARFVSAMEPNLGSRLSESLLKQMTGGDRFKVRELNKGFIEFRPQFKLTLGCNTLPDIRGTDHGIWRRLRVVPWKVQLVNDNEIDKDFGQKLLAELPGVFNWMLAGWAEYRELGLAPPEAVVTATADFRADRDRVGQFVEAVCTAAPDGRVSSKALHDAYVVWCAANAVDPISNNLFGRLIVGRRLKGGGAIAREKYGVIFYRGLELREEVMAELRTAVERAKAARPHKDVGDPPPRDPDDPGPGGPDG